MVVRGGYGINYDPYPLAFVRDLLGNYPSGIGLTVAQPNTFQPAGRLADGIPAPQIPDIAGGRIPVPGNITARTLDPEPNGCSAYCQREAVRLLEAGRFPEPDPRRPSVPWPPF